jgi:hypothetical protein
MYNDEIRKNIIDDLESKALSVANTAIALASQGYLINKNKYIKLDWTSVLIHAFENINVLSEEQQNKVELLYNKISKL